MGDCILTVPIPIPIARLCSDGSDGSDLSLSSLELEYISQLTLIEKKGYEIAKGLGTSFNLKRSNGFVIWMNARKNLEKI
jgi:hypothetical protein